MSAFARARTLLRPFPRLLRFLRHALLLGSSPIAGGLGAQSASSPLTAPPPVEAALARADSLYMAADLDASFAVAATLAAADPSYGAAGWRAARAAVVAGLLAEEEEEQNVWYRLGEDHAARALLADSLAIDVLFWLAAAKGRLALQAGAREAAELGDEVWRIAHRILEAEPDHAGAHNILGKLNHEVMTLSRFERFLGRLFLGHNEALDGSSWEGAESHQLLAITAEPEGILYRYDLALTYLQRGRSAEAEAELRIVLALPPRFPPDRKLQEDARRLVERLADGP